MMRWTLLAALPTPEPATSHHHGRAVTVLLKMTVSSSGRQGARMSSTRELEKPLTLPSRLNPTGVKYLSSSCIKRSIQCTLY